MDGRGALQGRTVGKVLGRDRLWVDGHRAAPRIASESESRHVKISPDDQPLHRDYGNHTLAVPRDDYLGVQLTCFILLSDVTEEDAPTKVVALEHTRGVPMGVKRLKMGNQLQEKEVSVCGPAGDLKRDPC